MSEIKDETLLSLFAVAQQGNKQFEEVGNQIYTTATKNNPQGVKMLRDLVNSPEFALTASTKDKKTISALKLLAPKLFQEPRNFFVENQGVGVGAVSQATKDYKELQNQKTAASMAGIDPTLIAEKNNKRGALQKIFAALTTTQRLQGGYFSNLGEMGMKEGADISKGYTNPYASAMFGLPLGGADITMPKIAQPQAGFKPTKEQRSAQMEKDLANSLKFGNLWWKDIKNDPSSPMQDLSWASGIKNAYPDTTELFKNWNWADEMLKSDSAVKALADDVNALRAKMGLPAHTYVEYGLNEDGTSSGKSKSEKVLNFILKMAATMAGSPGDVMGTALDIGADPFTYNADSLLTGGISKAIKGKVMSTTFGELLKGSKEATTAGQKFIAKTGQNYKTFARALSFTKDPIEKIMQGADRELGFEMNKWMNKTLMPTLQKAKTMGNNIEQLGEDITKWLDQPFETKMTVEMIAGKKPVTNTIITKIKELVGDSISVDEYGKLTAKLEEIDKKFGKTYDKIQLEIDKYKYLDNKKWVDENIPLNTTELQIQRDRLGSKWTPETAFRKWVKENGGIGPIKQEYGGAQGKKVVNKWQGEIADAGAKWFKSTKDFRYRTYEDQIIIDFVNDEPILARTLGFEIDANGSPILGADSKHNENLMIDLLSHKDIADKGFMYSDIAFEPLPEAEIQNIIDTKVADDMESQFKNYDKTHHSNYIGNTTGLNKYDRYTTAKEVKESFDYFNKEIDDAIAAGQTEEYVNSIKFAQKSVAKEARENFDDVLRIYTDNKGYMRAAYKANFKFAEVTPDELIKIANESNAPKVVDTVKPTATDAVKPDTKLFTKIEKKYKGETYGLCSAYAAKTQQEIGGKIVVGDYKYGPGADDMTRHAWVEKDGKIYDYNNIDTPGEVKLYRRDVGDSKYIKNRADSFVYNSVDELRTGLKDWASPDFESKFDTILDEINGVATTKDKAIDLFNSYTGNETRKKQIGNIIERYRSGELSETLIDWDEMVEDLTNTRSQDFDGNLRLVRREGDKVPIGSVSGAPDIFTPEDAKALLKFGNEENYIKSLELPPQQKLPETGEYYFIQTDDRSVYFGDDAHGVIANKQKVPLARIVDGGMLQDGVKNYSGRTTAADIGRRARAFLSKSFEDAKVISGLKSIAKTPPPPKGATMEEILKAINADEVSAAAVSKEIKPKSYTDSIKFADTAKKMKSGLKQNMPVVDYSGGNTVIENIETALAAKKNGLRTIPILVVDKPLKTSNFKTIVETIDSFKPAQDSLMDLYYLKRDIGESLQALADKIEKIPDSSMLDGFRYIDKGTGKEIEREVINYVTDYIDIQTPVNVKVKVPKEVPKDVTEIGQIIKEDLRTRGIENIGEENLKENYVPYRIKSEDRPKMVGRRQQGLLDYLSPEKQTFEYERKFKSIDQRVKAKVSTERNAFKTWTQYVFEGYKKKARLNTADRIIKELLNKPIDASGQIIAKDITALTPNEKMFWREVNAPELKGIFFDPEHASILDRVDQFALWDNAAKSMMNMFDKSLHLLKGYLTVANIGFHARNFYSNFWHLFLGWGEQAFNPKTHIEADTLLLSGRPGWKDVTLDVGPKYGKMKATDILEQAGRTGAYNTGFIRSDYVSAFLDKLEYVTMPKWQRIAERFNPVSRHFGLIHAGDVIGGYVENHARLVGYLNSLREGLSFEDAAIKVKKFLIDYTDLSPLEKNVFRKLFPFYSWLRKNTELEVSQMFAQPGKFALIPKIKNYVESLSEAPDDVYLYDYMKDLYAIRMPFGMDANGKFLFGDVMAQGGEQWYLNPNFPWQDLGKIGKVFTGDWKGALKDTAAMMNPFFKWPIEMVTNVESYSGAKIDDPNKPVKLAPSWAQILNYKGFLDKVLPGAETNPLTGELFITGRQEYASRQLPVLSNLAKLLPGTQSDTAKDPSKRFTDIMGAFGGIKFMPFNQPEAKSNYENKLINLLQTEMTKQRTLGQIIPYQDDMTQALRELYLRDADKETNFTGLQELDKFLGYTGSSPEMDYILKKLKQPYYDKKDKITNADLSKLVQALRNEGIEPKMEDIISILNEIKPGWDVQ